MKIESTITGRRRICKPDDDNITIDPELASLVPPLSEGELADLHRSIDAEEGCRDALIVWKGHDVLVDGQNRLKRCREKGYYPFDVIDKDFADRESVKRFIIHAQLGRRNLSRSAESYIRGKRYQEIKRQGQRSDLVWTSAQTEHKWASELLSEEFNVGAITIRRDATFATAVDRIAENCGPAVRTLILSKEIRVPRGTVLRVARLEPEEQRSFISDLSISGKIPRKTNRQNKLKDITVPRQPNAIALILFRQLGGKAAGAICRALAQTIERNDTTKDQPARKRRQ
jgi:hypothetical protein